MSFPKAKLKRFNEISVFSSPFCEKKDNQKSSGKKEKNKEKDKETQSCKTGSASEAESVKSSKSAYSRLFRTPSLPRRLKFRTHSESTPKKSLSSLNANLPPIPLPPAIKQKEALEAATVELRNKNQTLIEYENLIEELKLKNHRLEEIVAENEEINQKSIADIVEQNKEIEELKRGHNLLQHVAEGSLSKVSELEVEKQIMVRDYERTCDALIKDNLKLRKDRQSLSDEVEFLRAEVDSYNVSQKECENKIESLFLENLRLVEGIQKVKLMAHEDMLSYAEESNKLIQENDKLKNETLEMAEDLKFKKELMVELEEELSERQIEMDNQRDELRDEYHRNINCMMKKYEQQIATMKELHEMKVKEITSMAVLEKAKLIKEHAEEIVRLEKEKLKDIERVNETVEEKIRISEIQFEEKFKALELNYQNSIANEKSSWRTQLDQCQKIAESEIIQCEFEKRDLKTLLDSANELMREKDDRIKELECLVKGEEHIYLKAKQDAEVHHQELKEKCSQLMTDKHNYQLTLTSTRSTVNILMKRLKKSDDDVEIFSTDLELVNLEKSSLEEQNNELIQQLLELTTENEDYKAALSALQKSSTVMEAEMREKESVFEKLMTSEEETLETVNKLGKLFNDKFEENINRYQEMYNDLKRKYESRETYIKDMKILLDEFATGIEVARLELDTKDKKLFDLEEENRSIKLENMTYRFKCEHFEKYDINDTRRPPHPSPELFDHNSMVDVDVDDDGLVTNEVIQNIITELEKEPSNEGDELLHNKKEAQQGKQIAILQDIVQMENEYLDENKMLKNKLDEMMQKLEAAEKFNTETTGNSQQLSNQDAIIEDNIQLKNKITQLQKQNVEKEATIMELHELMMSGNDNNDSNTTTPRQMNISGKLPIIGGVGVGTPKTPRSLQFSTIMVADGKENKSPVTGGGGHILSPMGNVLRQRNN